MDKFRKTGRVEIGGEGWVSKRPGGERSPVHILDMGLGGASLEWKGETGGGSFSRPPRSGDRLVLWVVFPDQEASWSGQGDQGDHGDHGDQGDQGGEKTEQTTSELEILAEVRWEGPGDHQEAGEGEKGDSGPPRVGVVFLDMDPETTAQLASWLSTIPRTREI